MCGRFTLRTPLSKLIKDFENQYVQPTFPEFAPRYNVAPTQTVVGVVANEAGNRELAEFRWGLGFNSGGGNPLINARAETVATLPAFRESFRSRRCLVLADGFYEWQKKGKARQPFYFRFADDRPFAFAGIWSTRGKGDDKASDCAIITTVAQEPVASVHSRMPVILDSHDYALWLDDTVGESERLLPLLAVPQALVSHPVSSLVNSPGNDSETCLAPAKEEKRERTLFD